MFDLIKGANHVPVIGQPEIKDWSVSLVLKCPPPCGNVLLVQGKLGMGVVCLGCRKVYQVGQLQFTPEGELNVGMGVGLAPERK